MDDILSKISEGERLTLGISLIFVKLERWQYELLHPLDEATTILLEALQELSLVVLLHKKVGLALLFGELLQRSRDDVVLVDL